MKKMFGVISVAATLTMTAGMASAASSSDTTAKVPFAFIVGNVELPAGNYVVKGDTDTADVVVLMSADSHKYATTLIVEDKVTDPPTKPELVFQEYNGHYFLASVASEGTKKEVVLTPAVMQKEIAAASMNELASVGKRIPVN